jgi:hypothetical protein
VGETETPDAPEEETAAEPTPPPEEDAPPVEPTEVEPTLSFEEFTQGMDAHVQAALKRWMTLHAHDPNGHYTHALWQQYHEGMLGHIPG